MKSQLVFSNVERMLHKTIRKLLNLQKLFNYVCTTEQKRKKKQRKMSAELANYRK
jgi:hypothetical protein